MSSEFFENKGCKYYPCKDVKRLNCLLCFCPLYNYIDCGGGYTVLYNGVKDCSDCLVPHGKGGYAYIVGFLKRVNRMSQITVTVSGPVNSGKTTIANEIEFLLAELEVNFVRAHQESPTYENQEDKLAHVKEDVVVVIEEKCTKPLKEKEDE